MTKINWNFKKLNLLPNVRSVLICNNCGWLIQNPRKIDAEAHCDNCKKTYKETNSKIQTIEKEK